MGRMRLRMEGVGGTGMGVLAKKLMMSWSIGMKGHPGRRTPYTGKNKGYIAKRAGG